MCYSIHRVTNLKMFTHFYIKEKAIISKFAILQLKFYDYLMKALRMRKRVSKYVIDQL